MAITIQDVAIKAGVSVTTVSRVLNNRGSISEKTRTKVHAAMDELNYYPNQLAVNLFKKRSSLVGLIVPDTIHPFFATLIKHIEEYLYKVDYKLLLCNAGDNQKREKEYLNMLQCNKVDGIMIASHTLDLDEYSRVNLPVVAIDRYLGKGIPTISSNHEQGGRLAAEELLRSGCQKIAQVKGYSAVSTPSNERHTVFKEAVEQQGIECLDYELPFNAFRFTEYIDFVQDVLTNNPEIDGLFAVDNIAVAACKIASALGVQIPQQLKIVGYDGTELSLISNLSLSTVVQPIRTIAKTSVDTLLSMIQEENDYSKESHIRLPVTFIKRDTTP